MVGAAAIHMQCPVRGLTISPPLHTDFPADVQFPWSNEMHGSSSQVEGDPGCKKADETTTTTLGLVTSPGRVRVGVRVGVGVREFEFEFEFEGGTRERARKLASGRGATKTGQAREHRASSVEQEKGFLYVVCGASPLRSPGTPLVS